MSSRFAVPPLGRIWLPLALLLFGIAPDDSAAQEPTLRLRGLSPGGPRLSVTESTGMLEFIVENPTTIDRQARLLAFYETDPDVHYGKDFWIPAGSKLTGSMLLGPAPKAGSSPSRDIQFLLYDTTDGTERLIRPPGEEIRRSRTLLYQRRESTTALFLDPFSEPELSSGALPRPETRDQEAIDFVTLLRTNQGLSSRVLRLQGSRLPATPEAFAGIDQFVLASRHLENDPVGVRAMRQWLRQGGSLWVMLDRTDAESLAPLLEDALDFHVLGTLSLDQFTVAGYPKSSLSRPLNQKHDRPVDFVRVVLPTGERPLLSLDGWPVLFLRKVGLGQVVFSTIGPRATYRPRTPGDAPPPKRSPDVASIDSPGRMLPIPNELLGSMSQFLRNPYGEQPFSDQTFAKTLGAQIGYEVASIRTVAMIFGGFLLVELLLSWWLRRSRKPMLLLGLPPLTVILAAGTFFVLGENARRPVTTIAVGQVVNAVGNREEVTVRGLLAVYQPEAGPLVASAEAGGTLDVDRKGLGGQIGRRLMTDLDAWHWENLATPPGVRLAPFRFTAPTPEPMEAVVRFTATGLEGTVRTGEFRNVSDGVLCGPGDRRASVDLGSNGAAEMKASDMLPPDQFFTTPTLSDRQQRRLEVVREFVQADEFTRFKRENFLLAWADPIATPFNATAEARRVGEALLLLPVRFERPKPGSRFAVPAPCISYVRILEGMPMAPPRDGDYPIGLHLRFQLPSVLLPVKLSEARFTAKISAPSRRIVVKGGAGPRAAEVHRVNSPLNPLRVEINDPAALELDADGGLHLDVTISDLLEPPADPTAIKPFWKIEFLELEVAGEALAANP